MTARVSVDVDVGYVRTTASLLHYTTYDGLLDCSLKCSAAPTAGRIKNISKNTILDLLAVGIVSRLYIMNLVYLV